MKARGYTKETIVTTGMRPTALPDFNVGDTIAVHLRIQEVDKEGRVKERIQVFQGDVIGIKQNGASSSFTVRKIGAHSIPVERIIPFHSPIIKDITVVKRGDVRRAKLYYIRDRVGKSARIKEKREHKVIAAEKVMPKAVQSTQATSSVSETLAANQ